VGGARAFVATVLVVDDGSADGTGAVAAAAGARVVSHPRNQGKGAALLTGMHALAAQGFARALTMDGDGQHLPTQIPVLLAAADADPGALIVGARRVESQPVAALNLWANRFANRWVETACGQRIADTQSGFRVYPLPATLALGVQSGHFAFETEVLLRAARAGIPIRSVPVETYYPPPAERISHYRKWRDTLRIIRVVLPFLIRRG
jgi:glycosyltransferase involved in cell wall biosynthesis